MKQYDATETCAKCGFDRIEDEHRPGTIRFGIANEMIECEPTIARRCLRCKAIWHVLPLDANPRGGGA